MQNEVTPFRAASFRLQHLQDKTKISLRTSYVVWTCLLAAIDVPVCAIRHQQLLKSSGSAADAPLAINVAATVRAVSVSFIDKTSGIRVRIVCCKNAVFRSVATLSIITAHAFTCHRLGFGDVFCGHQTCSFLY